MKLITEYTDTNIEFFTETAKDGGEKKYRIEGIFAQSETKNRNGRMYPKKVMESAVGKYVTEQVKEKRSVGELNHPDGPTVNLNKVSHLITSLQFEGNDVVGKASILNTPNGKIVMGLLDGGVKLGVSTRGMGSLDRIGDMMVVKEDYVLSTIDIVQDPSASAAFVNGIMEGVNFFYDKETGLFERSELFREKMKKMTTREIGEQQMKLFKDYLSAF